MKSLYVLILAAGQGTRMKSATPKVLHPVAGRPMLEHVLQAVQALKPREIGVVLGHGREAVKQALEERGWKRLAFSIQRQPRGSGHAVQMAAPWLRGKKGTLLIVYGDTPLLTTATLRGLVDAHARSDHGATFLAMDLADPAGYGRMVVDGEGFLEQIVEDRDATPEEKRITLVNSGVACWDLAGLLAVLPKIRNDNAKREYYLTDAAGLLRGAGRRVGIVTAADPAETGGINHRVDLAEAEAVLRRRLLEHWMREGVTIVDPSTTYISAGAWLGPDVRLEPGTMILGESRIESGGVIGPYSIVESAVVRSGAQVGPFARVRPGSVIEPGARIGNFVEVKKTRVGRGSKVNHLSYLGDAEVGRDVNIGAGTITCNYDGFAKFRTIIEDDVFVGSNANLVAPVRLGRGAIVAAGSTVTEDVPPGALAVARARQVAKQGWARKFHNAQQKRRPRPRPGNR